MQLTGQGNVLSDRCICCGGAVSHGNRRSCLGHHDVQHLRAGSRSCNKELQCAYPERLYALRIFGKNREPFLIQSCSPAIRPAPATPFPCRRGWAPAARTQAASQGGWQGHKPTLRERLASSRPCSAARYAQGLQETFTRNGVCFSASKTCPTLAWNVMCTTVEIGPYVALDAGVMKAYWTGEACAMRSDDARCHTCACTCRVAAQWCTETQTGYSSASQRVIACLPHAAS